MVARTSSKKNAVTLGGVLERLEVAYGALVPSEDPIEAALLALLAEHAPARSEVQSRQALREAFVDWNEMRVADPWDVAHAIATKDPGVRAFAKAALKALSSIHSTLNRASFDRALANPEADIDALVAKMRGLPAHAQTVMLAVLAADGDWRPDKEISKVVQKLGLVAKTTSLNKVAQSLAAQADAEDRLRAHYLLARYAHRPDGAADPLADDASSGKAGSSKTTTRAKKTKS